MSRLFKLMLVLSQVAWTVPSLFFLMSWGRCAFMEGKVSVLPCSFGEGASVLVYWHRRLTVMMINRSGDQ